MHLITAHDARLMTEHASSTEKILEDISLKIKAAASYGANSTTHMFFVVDISTTAYLQTPEFNQTYGVRKALERLGYKVDPEFIAPDHDGAKHLANFCFRISW